MQVRKAVAGTVLGGGVIAMALAGAGTASATSHGWKPAPKPPTTKVSAQTNVSNSGLLGNGVVSQSSNRSGNITNTQVGAAFSVPVTAQLPVSLNVNGLNSKGSDTTQGQTATQDVDSKASANKADNYTQVNNANGNGNHSEVNIGSSAEAGSDGHR